MKRNEIMYFTFTNERGTVAFSPDGAFGISSISGDTAETTLTTTQSVGQIGETVGAQSLSAKSITVNGYVLGADAANLAANRAQLLCVFVPLVRSRFTATVGGQSWTLEGWLTRTPVIADTPVLQNFQFSFYAPYPYWRAPESAVELAGLTPRLRLPFFMSGTKKISEFTTDMFKLVPNIGTSSLTLRVALYAAHEVVRPVIHNANQNTHIRVNKTLLPGERFVLSTHEADKDEGNAALFYAVGAPPVNGFRFLEPGSDLDMRVTPGGNILLADADTGKENLRCTVSTWGGERHSL